MDNWKLTREIKKRKKSQKRRKLENENLRGNKFSDQRTNVVYLERIKEFDYVGCRADVNKQQLRKLISRQIAFGQ